MAKPISRLEAKAQTQPRRRKADRTSTRACVYIGHSQGERTEATLCDLSTFGCSIVSKAEWMRNGKFISIQFEDMPALQAIIRWVDETTAGLEFLRPIPAERAEWHQILNSHYIY